MAIAINNQYIQFCLSYKQKFEYMKFCVNCKDHDLRVCCLHIYHITINKI